MSPAADLICSPIITWTAATLWTSKQRSLTSHHYEQQAKAGILNLTYSGRIAACDLRFLFFGAVYQNLLQDLLAPVEG